MQAWRRSAYVGLAVAALGLVAFPASAQDTVEQFYKGKQINLIIGTSAGGGYDTYGRLVARRLGNYVPGNPAIVPQNMPGAGSNKAAGYVYSVAPKDGTVIGAIFSGAILQPLLGEPTGQHEPNNFLYVGNANSEVFLCLARSDAPVKTFADVFQQELIVGATSEGGSTRDFPTLLNNILGTKFRIVTGYAGSTEVTLALERGEIHRVVQHRRPAFTLAHRRYRPPPGAGSQQGTSHPQQNGRAADARVRQKRRRPAGDGACVQPVDLRPAVRVCAGRAGGARGRRAQGIHGDRAGQGDSRRSAEDAHRCRCAVG
jgi:hypothetical protein